jgi:DNA-directed RNA polymerase subunit omega
MARVTIEDCIDKIPNPYELVLVAANRARTIALGAPTTFDTNRDKPTVVALREIAQQTLSVDDLRQALIRSLQQNLEADEADASAAPMLPSQDHARIGGNEVDASVLELTEDQLLEAMQGVLPPDPSIPEREREPERAEEAEAARAADRQRG